MGCLESLNVISLVLAFQRHWTYWNKLNCVVLKAFVSLCVSSTVHRFLNWAVGQVGREKNQTSNTDRVLEDWPHLGRGLYCVNLISCQTPASGRQRVMWAWPLNGSLVFWALGFSACDFAPRGLGMWLQGVGGCRFPAVATRYEAFTFSQINLSCTIGHLLAPSSRVSAASGRQQRD